MKHINSILTVGVALLPVLSALIILWSDVQTIKATKVDFKEMTKFKVVITESLSKNTEAINSLNKLVEILIDERGNYVQQTRSN